MAFFCLTQIPLPTFLFFIFIFLMTLEPFLEEAHFWILGPGTVMWSRYQFNIIRSLWTKRFRRRPGRAAIWRPERTGHRFRVQIQKEDQEKKKKKRWKKGGRSSTYQRYLSELPTPEIFIYMVFICSMGGRKGASDTSRRSCAWWAFLYCFLLDVCLAHL